VGDGGANDVGDRNDAQRTVIGVDDKDAVRARGGEAADGEPEGVGLVAGERRRTRLARRGSSES
jgi:hypothetical protein